VRRLLRLGNTHRLRATAVAAGVAIGVLAVAFAGGALSGKLEHTPTYHGTGSLPPVVPTTAPGPDLTVIKAQLIEDMTLDVQSQRLDPDRAHRAAIAASPAAVTARHVAISLAWAPDKAPTIQAKYDKVVIANARSRTSPSVIGDAFVVTSWATITINGSTAVATLHGHFHLVEPTAEVDQTDQLWTIHLRLVNARWQLEDRSAV
jgi:hypothetical protein